MVSVVWVTRGVSQLALLRDFILDFSTPVLPNIHKAMGCTLANCWYSDSSGIRRGFHRYSN